MTILGEMCVISLICIYVALCRFCAVNCLIVICFGLLFSNYLTYAFLIFLVRFFLVLYVFSILCILFSIVLCVASPFVGVSGGAVG